MSFISHNFLKFTRECIHVIGAGYIVGAFHNNYIIYYTCNVVYSFYNVSKFTKGYSDLVLPSISPNGVSSIASIIISSISFNIVLNIVLLGSIFFLFSRTGKL
uniref:Uncharacterized protein n=1 Tax=Cacopsylla melanoneura TaxID=428564 RepID=A0A8D8RLB2_9HEMI